MKQACDKRDVVCMVYGTSFKLTDYKCKSESGSTDLCNQEAEKNGANFKMVSAIMLLACALVAFIRLFADPFNYSEKKFSRNPKHTMM